MGKYLSNIEAAKYIGFSPRTLNNARFLGQLAGVKDPEYIKVGRKVLYEQRVLDHWIDQFRNKKGQH